MASRAFDEWRLIQRDIRAFMRLGLRFARANYEGIWNEVSTQPADESVGLEDAFHQAVEGLWPNDFEWMHLAAVVKDAVSAFEVYLEKAADEILSRRGLPPIRKHPDWSPKWRELCNFYEGLGVEIESDEVNQVRELRHILTHQRGELRTDNQRQAFQAPDDVMAIYATLREADVQRHLDTVEAEVRRIDIAVYQLG